MCRGHRRPVARLRHLVGHVLGIRDAPGGVGEPHAMDRPGGAVERIQREVWRGLPWPQLRAKHREALIKLEGLAYSLLHRPPPSLRLRCAALFTHVCSVCTTTVARCG